MPGEHARSCVRETIGIEGVLMPSSHERARAARLPSPAILSALDASIQARRATLSNEILMRASIFAALVSATVIGISFLAQATQFSDQTALLALVLLPVTLFVGLTTFVRAVAVNREDAIAADALHRVHEAYVAIDPGLSAVLGGFQDGDRVPGPLGQGARQRPRNLAQSLTTTSSVIAALNAVLGGALASVVMARLGGALESSIVLGAAVALGAAFVQVSYAAKAREAPLELTEPASRAPSRARPRHESGSRSNPASRSPA
jgi:hypothetical protein